MTLPRFVVFKSSKFNDKYVYLLSNLGDKSMDGMLESSGTEVVSSHAKLEVERSKKGEGLVHIRSCYNNKYWRRKAENACWLIAQADKPEEDQSKWSCTLFQRIFADDNAKSVQLRHVYQGRYVNPNGQYNYRPCLYTKIKAEGDPDLFTIIDWESLLILPKHIAFKGDNGCYLSACKSDSGGGYLKFSSDDIGDPTVGNEIFTNGDGSIRIKSDYFGEFWECEKNQAFVPIKIDDNVIALRSLGNNNFCNRRTNNDHLSAIVSTISKQARLEVEDLVLSRKIYNVDFRLSDARIYSQSVLTMATGVIVNRTDETNTVDLKLFYEETKSSRWDASVSLTLGVSTTIQAGIPCIEGATVTVSAEFTGTYEWGKCEVSVTEVETVYRATVPPMTRVKVSLLATKGTCDVPFSYSQRDTLTNGEQIIHDMDDGLYTGINCFNFKYESSEETLAPKEEKEPTHA